MTISEECKKVAEPIPGLLESIDHLQVTYLRFNGRVTDILTDSLDSLSRHVKWMGEHGQIEQEPAYKAQVAISELRRDFNIAKSNELADILFYGVLNKVVECECKKPREDFWEKCPRCGGTRVWPPGTKQSCDLCGGTGLVPRG